MEDRGRKNEAKQGKNYFGKQPSATQTFEKRKWSKYSALERKNAQRSASK